MMPATPQQAGKKAYQAAIAAGKEPDEAMVDLVEATMGAVPGDAKAKAGLDYSVDADAIRLRVAGEEGLTLPRNFNGLSDVQAQHSSLLDFMQTYKLMGNEGALNISSAMFGMRSSVYSAENIERQSKYAFDSGVVEGIYKVNSATAQRNANFTGFRGDLMTQEDWGRTISAHTQKWARQDASDVVTLISIAAMAPMLVADLAVLGVAAGRGALTLGRGLMNGADDLGRSLYSSIQANGIRGTVLNVGSTRTGWAAVESANLSALRSTALRLPSTLETSINRGAIALMNQANVGLRTIGARLGSTSDDIIAGSISGVVNVAFEYAKNPDKAFLDYAGDFGAGFIGGSVGNRVGTMVKGNMLASGWGSKQALIVSEGVGGFVSGSLAYMSSQRLNGKSIDYVSAGSAGLLGSGIGIGVAATLPRVFSSVTQFGLNSTIGGFSSSSEELNNRFEYFIDTYFGR